MTLVRALHYFITRGVKGIWNNLIMCISSTGIVAASLVLFGIFLLVSMNINAVLMQINEECEINVYISRDVENVTLSQIEGELKKIEGVSNVKFFSRDDRLKRAEETTYKNKEYMIEDLKEDNPIRDAYIISATDIDLVDYVSEQALHINGVDEVQSSKEMIEYIQGITGNVRKIGFWITIILSLLSMFIITNTIRLGLLARSREITVMRYVGAANWYIRGPFVAEGIFLGLTGSIIAALIVIIGYGYGINAVNSLISGSLFKLLGLSDVWKTILTVFICIGVGIGFIGSEISIRRYLKV